MQKRIIEGVEVQRSSGNVFADLGLPDAEKLKIKTGLVVEIRRAMRAERKLMDCLNRLGYDIEIKVRPAAEPIGHLTLATA
jgi:hypothetical protein